MIRCSTDKHASISLCLVIYRTNLTHCSTQKLNKEQYNATKVLEQLPQRKDQKIHPTKRSDGNYVILVCIYIYIYMMISATCTGPILHDQEQKKVYKRLKELQRNK